MLAHSNAPLLPHDSWTAWSFDIVTLGVIVVAAASYARGLRSSVSPRRVWAFIAAVVAALLALVSPIDGLADTLLVFHMVQHILLVSVLAPLIAIADPWPVIRRGLPAGAQGALRSARRRAGLGPEPIRRSRDPVLRFVAFVVVLWLWHAARLYSLAVDNRWVHTLEHLSFVVVAVGVWSVMVGAVRQRSGYGAGVAMAFGLMLQGVALSGLMVFARQPWYPVYGDIDPAWGLTPLGDQHLAGLIMWFIGGAAFIVAGVALVVSWLRSDFEEAGAVSTASAPRSLASDGSRSPGRLPGPARTAGS